MTNNDYGDETEYDNEYDSECYGNADYEDDWDDGADYDGEDMTCTHGNDVTECIVRCICQDACRDHYDNGVDDEAVCGACECDGFVDVPF